MGASLRRPAARPRKGRSRARLNDPRTRNRKAPALIAGIDLRGDLENFTYGRAGIVHIGIGAFHRAHQAWYTDLAMEAGARDWSIIGVSLRSPDVAAQLNSQDGLCTATERSAAGSRTRLVGAVAKVLVASEEPETAVAAVAAPAMRIITFTVTEKGYRRAADGSLDPALAGRGSIVRFLAEGLRQRHDAGLSGLT